MQSNYIHLGYEVPVAGLAHGMYSEAIVDNHQQTQQHPLAVQQPVSAVTMYKNG